MSNDKKIILIITDNISSQVNGVVTTFKNIEQFATQDNYKIVYLTPEDFPHWSCPGYPEVKISWPWRIGKKIKSIAPDYIHICTEGPVGLVARLYLDGKGYRYNTSYHTRFPEFLKEIYDIPEKLTYSYLRWFHKHSGIVLTTTCGMTDDLLNRGFKNVIPWTRGVNRLDLTPTASREQNKIPVLLTVGRISKEKGLDDLVNLQWDYTIVIVGDGPYRQELERKMPNAEFVGYKSGSELANYYQQADVFVFPSRTDTFGLVMIEAMSLGTPVAAFPVRGPLDVIEQNVTGVMDHDLYSAVRAALRLNRDQVKIASNVWSWAQTWDIFKQHLINLR
jgi:glycosyltransferase involved in cell wall biosynthesis